MNKLFYPLCIAFASPVLASGITANSSLDFDNKIGLLHVDSVATLTVQGGYDDKHAGTIRVDSDSGALGLGYKYLFRHHHDAQGDQHAVTFHFDYSGADYVDEVKTGLHSEIYIGAGTYRSWGHTAVDANLDIVFFSDNYDYHWGVTNNHSVAGFASRITMRHTLTDRIHAGTRVGGLFIDGNTYWQIEPELGFISPTGLGGALKLVHRKVSEGAHHQSSASAAFEINYRF